MAIDSDLIRGHVDTIILKTLASGEKYGYEIIKEIETKSNGTYELKQPTLYSCLKRLEDQELITSYWVNSDIGGKRHYYNLTEKGKELYNKNMEDWLTSKLIIDSLIGIKATEQAPIEAPINDNNENENIVDEDDSIKETILEPIIKNDLIEEIDSQNETKINNNEENETINDIIEENELAPINECNSFEQNEKEMFETQMAIDNEQNNACTTISINDLLINPEAEKIDIVEEYYNVDENQIDLFNETNTESDIKNTENEDFDIKDYNENAFNANNSFEFKDTITYNEKAENKVEDDLQDSEDDIINNQVANTVDETNIEEHNNEEEVIIDNLFDNINNTTDSINAKLDEAYKNAIHLTNIEESMSKSNELNLEENQEETSPLLLSTVEDDFNVNDFFENKTSFFNAIKKDEDNSLTAQFNPNEFTSSNQIIDKNTNNNPNIGFSNNIIQNVNYYNVESQTNNIENEVEIDYDDNDEDEDDEYNDEEYQKSYNDNDNKQEYKSSSYEHLDTTNYKDEKEYPYANYSSEKNNEDKTNNVNLQTQSTNIEPSPMNDTEKKLFQKLDNYQSYSPKYTEKEYKDILNNLAVYGNAKIEEPEVFDNKIEQRKMFINYDKEYDNLSNSLAKQGISTRVYKRLEKENSTTKAYLLTNKIKMVSTWVVCLLMLSLLAVGYLIAKNVGYLEFSANTTKIYFIIASLFNIAIPVYYSCVYFYNPTKKAMSKYNVSNSTIFATLFLIQCLIIICAVNILFGFNSFKQTNYNHLNWLIPSICSMLLVVSSLVYSLLFKSKKFNI